MSNFSTHQRAIPFKDVFDLRLNKYATTQYFRYMWNICLKLLSFIYCNIAELIIDNRN